MPKKNTTETADFLKVAQHTFFNEDKKQEKSFSLPFLNSVSTKDLVFFTRELSILLNASVPIVQAFRILSKQMANKRLKEVVTSVAGNVEGGLPVSAALAEHPKVFDNLFISLIKTGEVSGTLDKSLTYIADQLEKDFTLKRKVRGAMAYPLFVLSAMTVVMGVLFAFVMPKMLQMLTDTDAALPFTTKVLIAVTGFASNFWWLFLVLIIAAIVAFKYVTTKPAGLLWWDSYKVKIPIVGGISKKVYLERFSRNFGILVMGGVPIVNGLRIAADGIGNTAYRKAILEVADNVENGQSLAIALAEHQDKIPELVVRMIDVGEQTSKIDEILLKMATFYERESEQSISTLTQLLEPIIMLVLGGMVAIIVSGILLPIYSLVNAQ